MYRDLMSDSPVKADNRAIHAAAFIPPVGSRLHQIQQNKSRADEDMKLAKDKQEPEALEL